MRGRRTRRRRECRAGVFVLCGIGFHAADAQQMDPRSYSNVPIGLNFVAVAFAHSEGDVLVDPSVPIEDVQANVDVAAVAYVRTFALADQSATIGLVAPYAWVSASGLVEGQSASVSREGIGDPTLRLTVNLRGAPALPGAHFGTYQQDLIVGMTLLVTAPLGHYRPEKLVNIGTNRWSVKPEMGVSRALGRWTLEGALGATLYSDNDEFFGNRKREQDPLYAMQVHAIYHFNRRFWGSLDATYYHGGRTTVEGVRLDDLQENSRWGAHLSYALTAGNSVKLYFSSGASSRTGTDFETLGLAWQYGWAGSR